MAVYYPGNIKNDFSSKVDFTDTVIASHINDLQGEVTAIETTLGTFPLTSSGWGTSGFDTTTTTWSSVKDRLYNIEIGIANTRAQVAAITAETLAGTTLKSTITGSSLVSFGASPVLNDPKIYHKGDLTNIYQTNFGVDIFSAIKGNYNPKFIEVKFSEVTTAFSMSEMDFT